MESQIPLTLLKNKTSLTGNIGRIEQIFAEHGDFIRAAIRFHVKNEAACDDLFQEFFMSLIVNPIPKDVKNIRGFLYRAIAYRAKDTFRKVTRYRTKLRGYAEKCQHPVVDNHELTAIENEDIKKIFAVMHEHLPKKETMAMLLKYTKDSNNKEIAKNMGVNSATVSSYICAGTKKIRRVLKSEGRLYDSP